MSDRVEVRVSSPVDPPGISAARAAFFRSKGGAGLTRRLDDGWDLVGAVQDGGLRLVQPARPGRLRETGFPRPAFARSQLG